MSIGLGNRLERFEHFGRARVTLRWILRECLEYDRVERRRNFWAPRRWCRRRLVDDRHHRLEVRLALVQAASGQQLEQQDAEREDVAAAIDVPTLALLGR